MSDSSEGKKLNRAIVKMMTTKKKVMGGEKLKYSEVVGAINILNGLLPPEFKFAISKTMRELIRNNNSSSSSN